MQNFRYVGKNLFIEKLSIANILKKNKTPFYLYSENQIINNYLKFTKNFKKTNPLVCAEKQVLQNNPFLNQAVYRSCVLSHRPHPYCCYGDLR